jgi:hypothetical protein
MEPKKQPVKYTPLKLSDDDQIALSLGQSMMSFFALKSMGKVDYLTAGNRKFTDEYTIILKLPNGRVEYCTFKDAKDVATDFTRVIGNLVEECITNDEVDTSEVPF